LGTSHDPVKYREYMESTSLSDALINLIPMYGPWIIFGIVGNAVVFFRRLIAVLRMFAALLAGANCMPAGRFFFFNMTGGVCWALSRRDIHSQFSFMNSCYALERTQLCQIIRADYQLPLMARNGPVGPV
jgi:hypothetical protein